MGDQTFTNNKKKIFKIVRFKNQLARQAVACVEQPSCQVNLGLFKG